MEIYLTFDDGIQDGTEEVLGILKETGVKATFFLVGIELAYTYKKEPAKCLKLVSEIYENHAIGNHTYYHANDDYTDYYLNNGVVIDNYGNKMPIIDDFIKGKDQINHYLRMICGKDVNEHYPLAKEQKTPLARFPGRNNWCIPGALPSMNSPAYRLHCEAGTREYTQRLFNTGYHIFGWNTEWKMDFDFHHDALSKKREIEKTRTLDYSKEEDVHPNVDMCAEENLGKDRLTEDWKKVIDKIIGSTIEGKAVLLMHERAFRKGFAQYDKSTQTSTRLDRSGNSEAGKLRSLIYALKELNAEFKTLDEYLPSANNHRP